MLEKTKYRNDIQALRGVAVLAVLLFHAFDTIFPKGYLGVDVFFVISGFVVTPLILRIFTGASPQSVYKELCAFYRRRFFRLAPALTVTLAFTAAILFLIGPISDHQRIARSGIATLLLIGNLGAYKYAGNYFSPNPNPLVHTWSLSVEEQIYLLLPIILIVTILGNRKFNQSSSVIQKKTAGVFLIITVVSFISFMTPRVLQPLYFVLKVNIPDDLSFYLPLNRIWQFCFGGLAFLLVGLSGHFKNRFHKLKSLLQILVLIFILAPFHSDYKTYSLFASCLSVMVILFNTLDALPISIIRGLKWVGDRSYSIYLVHLPLMYVAKYSPHAQIEKWDNRYLQSVLALLASIILGSLSFTKIENKFRNIGNSKPIRFKNFTVAVLLTFVLPLFLFMTLDRTSSFGISNSGMPVPSKILPWSWDEDCQFFSRQSKVNSEPCKYGNHKSGKSILLIGDSHAAAASRAIISLGDQNSMDAYVFTYEACGFVLNREDIDLAYTYPYLSDGCMQHNRLILDFVKKKKPTVIVLAMHDSSIMISPYNSNSRNLYLNMIAKNLYELRNTGARILQIGNGPVLRPLLTRTQGWLKSKSSYSDIPAIENRFWKNKKVADYYLDTLEIFCPGNICSNKSKKGWLFHDADHLSEIGAESLLPYLDPLLKEILQPENQGSAPST